MPGKPRRLLVTAAAVSLALFGLACVMPSQGTPVFVDVRAGDWWSGDGLLTEVSEDKRQCRVSVRDRALIVQDLWVDCQRVHRRDARH
jgi:hypothetical protein